MEKRIVLVGAGSALFTKGILGSLVTDKEFADCTLVLMDINPEILSLMECYARRLVRDNRSPLIIEATACLAEALEGADFVVCTVAAQDARARQLEIEVPLRFGYHHSWGDTTGPAGIFRALRHIPIFCEIAREMEKRCPQGWLLNFTNPMAALCRAVNRVSEIKIMGFCDGPPYFRRLIEQEVFGLPEGRLKTRMAGVDHAVWVLEMEADGVDLMPQFSARLELLREKWPVQIAIFETYGYFACPGNEHLAEFFPFFLRDETSMLKYGLKDMDIAWHRNRRDSLNLELVKEIQAATPVRPAPLPPEEEVLEIIRSIALDSPREYITSLPNRNVISNLPEYAIVEASVLIGRTVRQLPPVFIPPQLTGILQMSVIKDEMVVEAALTGNRELTFQAVLACPLIKSIDQARDITSAMYEAMAELLPKASVGSLAQAVLS